MSKMTTDHNEIESTFSDSIKDFIDKNWPLIKDFAKVHTALFIFLATTMITVISLIGKIFFYSFQVGYNAYFNVSNNYIEISGNFLFDLVLYAAITFLILFFNYAGIICLKKRKFFSYFIFLTIILYVIYLMLTLTQFSFTELISYLPANLIILLILSIFTAIYLNILPILMFKNKKIQIARLYTLIRKEEKKNNTTRVKDLLKKINELKETNKCLNNQRCIDDQNKDEQTDHTFTILYYLFIFAFSILSTCLLGHIMSRTDTSIKIITNDQINVEGKSQNYAVLYENDDIYLICPCEENDKNQLILNPKVQMEVNKPLIVTIDKSYKRITK